MPNQGRSMPDELRSAGAEAEGLREEVAERAQDIKGSLRDIATIVKDAVAEKISELREDASNYGRRGVESVREFKDDAIALVERKPLKALLIAAGAGVVLGFMLRGRGD